MPTRAKADEQIEHQADRGLRLFVGIERDLARCAVDLGLPQPSFWCTGTVERTVAGVGKHPPDVCFRFNVTLPPDETGWSSFARGRACAWDDEVHCSVTQGIRDPF